MNLKLQKLTTGNHQSIIKITGSKSESNRLLLLQALYPEINIENLSNSDDSKVMQIALQSKLDVVDVHHAGTAMRFLTAYFAIQKDREVTITGSARMKERPIKILVDALTALGADITYLEDEGFPPLKIKGKAFTKSKVTLSADVSSQYISALLLIAPKLENGLELTLEGKITSVPYIKMTLALLNAIGVKTAFDSNVVRVNQQSVIGNYQALIESDWSSASYYYSIIALSAVGTQITLNSYKSNSLQGDSALVEIYKQFGVETTFLSNKIQLVKKGNCQRDIVYGELENAPDIAQTIAVTCLGLGVACHLTGLHTLKIKETDRLVALKTEIEKLGTPVEITDNSLRLSASKAIVENVKIATYQDHRMAMAFAPLALRVPLIVEDADVVSKSYPSFWEDLKTVGFKISE